MKINVAEATNIQLNWLVAKIEGLVVHHNAYLEVEVPDELA